MIRLTGRQWTAKLSAELEDFLRRLFQFQSIAQKNPGDPTTIQAGVAASPGTTATAEPLAKDDHVHPVLTGTPVSVGTANSEGTSTALTRADHVHDGSAALYLSLVM